MRFKLTIAYNGTPFKGWQSQPSGNTIQDYLEKAFASIAGKTITLHGAGRTDSGVHALAQSAHIDLELPQGKMNSLERWLAALHATLPPEIRILKIQPVSQTFHARFSAHGKIYRYQLWHDKVLPPFEHERAWQLYGPLDRRVLQELAQAVTGTHDFRGFTSKSGAAREDTRRTITAAKVRHYGKKIDLTFQGTGFLYHMIRMLVGGMVDVARGKTAKEKFLHRLHDGKPSNTPRLAPACGLYLVKVIYKNR